MNPSSYFAFDDFARALENLQNAFGNENDRYLMLTGETGVGKTWLCRQLNNALDRCRHRVLYFSHARHLGATALIRVLATLMRLPTRRSHSETLQGLVTALGEQPNQLLIWFDEAHELPDETLLEAKALAESDLYDSCPVRILLIGLPLLRDRLQAIAPLWRRIVVREELTGLTFDELPSFIEHHFGTENLQRICQQGMHILFERARGIPGLVVPRFKKILAESKPDGPIDPLTIDDILQRWELT
jgi:type II secretory pathway predicted ATPase ExeA